MKLTLALILIGISLARSATADSTLIPYDSLGKSNVSVNVELKNRNVSANRNDPSFLLSYDVSVRSVASGLGTSEVEFYVVRNFPGYRPYATLVQRQEAAAGVGTFNFTCDSAQLKGYSEKEIGGWIVRVVRDGMVVGFASSSQKYSDAASNPDALKSLLQKVRL